MRSQQEKTQIHLTRKHLHGTCLGLIWLGLMSLTACTTQNLNDQNVPTAQPQFSYVQNIEITPTDRVETIESHFGGKVIVWQPNDGFAIIGTNTPVTSVTTSGTTTTAVSSNLGAVSTSEDVYAGGFARAWAGGFARAWAGGFARAWADGSETTWADQSEVNWFVDGLFPNSSFYWGSTKTTPGAVLVSNLYAFAGSPFTSSQNGGIRLGQAFEIAPKLGQGVKVAVIDTGVDLGHPALKDRLAPAGDWKDFVDGDAIPQEVSGGPNALDNEGFGHGTGVAGVIAQVAPKAQIMPIRILGSDGSGDATALVSAIEWAVNRGARVINLSVGMTERVDAVAAMVRWAHTKGVFVVISAGNSNDTQVTYPAADAKTKTGGGSRVISVGSVGSRAQLTAKVTQTLLGVADVAVFDHKSVFSTYGPAIKIMAPGELMATLAPNNRIGFWTGTSFAAPVVSATLALALGEPLNATQLSQVAAALTSSADKVDACNPDFAKSLGAGRLNAEAFLRTVYGWSTVAGESCKE
jgi:subtilisin family serine protease